MPAAAEFNLDDVLIEIGEFGRYQVYQIGILSVAVMMHAIFTMNYVFVSGTIDHRCFIPECETRKPNSATVDDFEPTWLKYAVPYYQDKPALCSRYKFKPPSASENEENTTSYRQNTCTKLSFTDKEVECTDLVFREEDFTIMREWDLTCSETWKLALTGTLNNVGQLICMLLIGPISDRFGRRSILVISGAAVGCTGLIQSFSMHLVMFLALELINTIVGCGIYTAAFILGLEMVGPSKRMLASVLVCNYFSIGEALVGALAWRVQDWKMMLRIIYPLCFVLIAFQWLFPESVRWLLTQGRGPEAAKIIQRAARWNHVELAPGRLQALLQETEAEAQSTNEPKNSLLVAFKSKRMVWRLCKCSFCWLTNTLVFYGLSLTAVALASNRYMSYILISLIELPGYWVMHFIAIKLGRRTILSAMMAFSGVACLGTWFISDPTARLICFLLGKFSITISFAMVYVYTAELFPTSFRHTMVAICSSMGRIGSSLAPQTPLLGKIWGGLPSILFFGFAALATLMALTLPETMNTTLPDTIEQAEALGKKPSRTNATTSV